jgi:hypothetical protein
MGSMPSRSRPEPLARFVSARLTQRDPPLWARCGQHILPPLPNSCRDLPAGCFGRILNSPEDNHLMRSPQKQNPSEPTDSNTLKRAPRFEVRHQDENNPDQPPHTIPPALKQKWTEQEMEEPERWDGMS